MQLAGGEGYMRTAPGIKPLGEELSELGDIGLGDPIGSIGVLAEALVGRLGRQFRPSSVTRAHEELTRLAEPLTEQVQRLRSEAEALLRKHRKGIIERQFQQKRLADAVSDIYAQVAVLSRVTSIFEEQGVEPSGQERYIAETFCTRAARRVHATLDQVEHNDDERMTAIAKLAYKRGAYGYALFED
jgi:acyl-CoA dehydrogenase family protein 9